jgi:hypothetical protein
MITKFKLFENNIEYQWYMKTKDFNEIAFYFDDQNKISPLEYISDFDGGDYWIVDCGYYTGNFYPTYPNDDSFFMIPKDDIISVWCEEIRLRKDTEKYNI